MAACNMPCFRKTDIINVTADVHEITTSGKTRKVRLILQAYTVDSHDERAGGYALSHRLHGKLENATEYNNYCLSGTPKTILDETFQVSIKPGTCNADVQVNFSVWVDPDTSVNPTINGGVYTLFLTAEPPTEASTVSLSSDTVPMGGQIFIKTNRANPEYTHELLFIVNGKQQEIATGVGASYLWRIPDLTHICNNATSCTCTIHCTTRHGEYSIGATITSFTLTVPKAAVPVPRDNAIELGKQCTIACARGASNFSVKLELEIDDNTVFTSTGRHDFFLWTLSYELSELFPNLDYCTGLLKCTTFNGTAVVGETSKTVRVYLPQNAETLPLFSPEDLVLTPISDLEGVFGGMYIRGKTGLKASMSAFSNWSTIESYVLTIGNLTVQGNPAVIDTLPYEGYVKVTAKATDARGFSTTVSTDIYIVPYQSAKIIPYSGYSEVICDRAKANGELCSDGTYLAIKAGKRFSSIILNGVEQNHCSLRYRWKSDGATSYTEWVTLLAEGSAENEVALLVGNVVSSSKRSYMVQIEAADTLGSKHTLNFQIMTEAISFALFDGQDGAAFGKYPEAPHVVDIASHMTLLVRGKLELGGAQWTNLGFASGISESDHPFGRAENRGCHYMIPNGKQVYIAFNCAFTYAGTDLIVNSEQIPEEYRPHRSVFGLCLCNDRCVAGVSVGTDGYIRVEWVQKATDAVLTGAADITWVDGYLNYWL